jgi:hypothetical protein
MKCFRIRAQIAKSDYIAAAQILQQKAVYSMSDYTEYSEAG